MNVKRIAEKTPNFALFFPGLAFFGKTAPKSADIPCRERLFLCKKEKIPAAAGIRLHCILKYAIL